MLYMEFENRSGGSVEADLSGIPTIKDEIIRLSVIKVSGKAKGLDMVMGRGGELRVSYKKVLFLCLKFN